MAMSGRAGGWAPSRERKMAAAAQEAGGGYGSGSSGSRAIEIIFLLLNSKKSLTAYIYNLDNLQKN